MIDGRVGGLFERVSLPHKSSSGGGPPQLEGSNARRGGLLPPLFSFFCFARFLTHNSDNTRALRGKKTHARNAAQPSVFFVACGVRHARPRASTHTLLVLHFRCCPVACRFSLFSPPGGSPPPLLRSCLCVCVRTHTRRTAVAARAAALFCSPLLPSTAAAERGAKRGLQPICSVSSLPLSLNPQHTLFFLSPLGPRRTFCNFDGAAWRACAAPPFLRRKIQSCCSLSLSPLSQ